MSEVKIYECCISRDILETFIAFDDVRLKTVDRLAIEEGPNVYLSKPDAIDLARRILEHFDVWLTRDEMVLVIDFAECREESLECTECYGPDFIETKECQSIQAKLRRLVGEE